MMATGPIYPQYAYTVWTIYGPLRFYYASSNWPPEPWLNTRNAKS